MEVSNDFGLRLPNTDRVIKELYLYDEDVGDILSDYFGNLVMAILSIQEAHYTSLNNSDLIKYYRSIYLTGYRKLMMMKAGLITVGNILDILNSNKPINLGTNAIRESTEKAFKRIN